MLGWSRSLGYRFLYCLDFVIHLGDSSDVAKRLNAQCSSEYGCFVQKTTGPPLYACIEHDYMEATYGNGCQNLGVKNQICMRFCHDDLCNDSAEFEDYQEIPVNTVKNPSTYLPLLLYSLI